MYIAYMKALLDIPERQIAYLDELCSRQQVSRAEAIRRAIDFYAEHHKVERDRRQFLGRWADRSIDSLHYEDELRSEWH